MKTSQMGLLYLDDVMQTRKMSLTGLLFVWARTPEPYRIYLGGFTISRGYDLNKKDKSCCFSFELFALVKN